MGESSEYELSPEASSSVKKNSSNTLARDSSMRSILSNPTLPRRGDLIVDNLDATPK